MRYGSRAFPPLALEAGGGMMRHQTGAQCDRFTYRVYP